MNKDLKRLSRLADI